MMIQEKNHMEPDQTMHDKQKNVRTHCYRVKAACG